MAAKDKVRWKREMAKRVAKRRLCGAPQQEMQQ
jgi:hypothetical protein